MPIYEYKCTKCNEVIEVIQKMNDEPLSKCNECGGKLKKMITNTSFVLKGSGWYVTDYPSENREKAMKAKKSAGKKEASADQKKDSKKKETAKTE
ncbi:MAG: zinc ribbon domain-containing protein [Thermodesulfovibrionia bacterium]|nr:zinc ribbon domain-containing protein [Thermodesulfovibrionia bacterium]